MIEKLGPRKYAFPVLVIVLIGCAMALMFYPMVNMAPKHLPFGVISLDEGAQTPQGAMNAGESMVDELAAAEAPAGADSAPIKWEVFENQDDLDAALADNELYGALTIPPGFTEAQVLAQAGEGEAPAVDVVLDNAKSPLAATQMQALLGTMFDRMGIRADIAVINTGDIDAPSASPMAGMMSQQLGILPLMIMSLVGSILLTRIFPRRLAGTNGGRFAVLGKQLAYTAALSLLAALAAVILLNTLVGAAAPFWTTAVFLWFSSFTVMALFLGAFNIAMPLGGLVAFCAVLLGMMTAVLGQEMLPAFWADWVYPWAPQHMIGDGLRDILYRGADLMPRGTGGLLALGGSGFALMLLSGFIPGDRTKEERTGSTATSAAA